MPGTWRSRIFHHCEFQIVSNDSESDATMSHIRNMSRAGPAFLACLLILTASGAVAVPPAPLPPAPPDLWPPSPSPLLTATTPRIEQRIRADLAFAEAERLLAAGDRDAAIARWLGAATLYHEFDRLREADAYLAAANACSPFPVGGDERPDLTKLLKKMVQDPNRLLSDLESAMNYYNLAFLAATAAYEELCTPADCFPNLDAERSSQAETLYRRGLDAYEAGRYDDAITDLQDAATTYQTAGYPPGQVRALVALSQAYFRQDPVWGALNALLTLLDALALVEDFPVGDATDVRYLEGLHAYEQGRFQEAIAIWSEVIPRYEAEQDDKQLAVTRTNLGNAYGQSGNYAQALALYTQALPTFEALADVANRATVHHNWGNTLLLQGAYLAALEQYELALTDWRAIGDRRNEAASLDGGGLALIQLGRHAQAEAYLQTALGFQQQLNDRPGEADSLTNLGTLDLQRGHYAQAEDDFRRALALWQEEKNQTKELQLLSNLAAAQTGAGQIEQAQATYDQALHLAEVLNDRLARAYILANQGNLYANQGDVQTALGHYHQALAIFQEYDHRAGMAQVASLLGQAYLLAGDLSRAQVHLEQALEEAQATGQTMNIANAHYALGTFWLLFPSSPPGADFTPLTEAEAHLQAALSLWEELENQDGQTLALNYLARLYQEQGHPDQALSAQTRAFKLATETGNRLLQVRAGVGLGLIQLEHGDLEAARQAFVEAQTQATAIGDVRGELVAWMGQGYEAIKEGDPAAALATFQQAVDRLEAWHGLLTLPELKMTFLDRLADLYDLAAYLAYQQNQPERAFEYVEQGKARVFLEQLANLRLTGGVSADIAPDLAEREARIRGEIARLFSELEKAQTQTPPDPDRLAAVGEQLEAQRRAYADLLLEMHSQDPAYQEWQHPSILPLTELQAHFLAGRQVTLIEYATSPLGTLAWVIDGENATLLPLPVDDKGLAQKVSYWYNLVTNRSAGASQASRELYDLLLAPLRPHIRHSRLLIVPHGPLHWLSFAALNDGEHDLIQDYTLSYLPSASSLPFFQDKGTKIGRRALILGDPDGSLPHAAAEAKAIADLYGVTPLLGRQATEEAVKQQGKKADLLHLAVHGVYQPLSPLFSRLDLAADGKEDGRLEVHEIYSLDLTETDLVVLSACRSQAGQVSNGDEVVALNRAFLSAGAPAVIADLWPVEDAATAKLMAFLYREMQTGASPASALQSAQRALLADPATAHPYYWAAFGLTGAVGEVTIPTPPPAQPTERKGRVCALSLSLPLLVGGALFAAYRCRAPTDSSRVG